MHDPGSDCQYPGLVLIEYKSRPFESQASTQYYRDTLPPPITSLHEGAVPIKFAIVRRNVQYGHCIIGLPWLPQPVPLGQNEADSPLKHAPVHN